MKAFRMAIMIKFNNNLLFNDMSRLNSIIKSNSEFNDNNYDKDDDELIISNPQKRMFARLASDYALIVFPIIPEIEYSIELISKYFNSVMEYLEIDFVNEIELNISWGVEFENSEIIQKYMKNSVLSSLPWENISDTLEDAEISISIIDQEYNVEIEIGSIMGRIPNKENDDIEIYHYFRLDFEITKFGDFQKQQIRQSVKDAIQYSQDKAEVLFSSMLGDTYVKK